MIVNLASWWLMEWVCRRLWTLYAPDVKFRHEHHVDPIQVAMALQPTHWGRFVAYSIWLQEYAPDLPDRIVVYKILLQKDPQFIPCFYHLLGRWLWGSLWPPRRNGAERRRKRRLLRPMPTLLLPVLFCGLRRYARAQKLSRAQAQDVLRKDFAYTLHRPPYRRFQMAPVLVLNIDQQWVADLVDMQRFRTQNKGVRYLLMVVDVLSKYAWVRTIKHKTGVEMVGAFESILEEGRRLQTLQTDKGKEFYNATMKRWLEDEGIHHFSTLGDTKAAIAERFNRTLKTRLYRYFTAANTLQYLDVFQSLVDQYNADVHRSIDMASRDVDATNEVQVWQRLYGKVTKTRKRERLKVGDMVRLTERIRPFKKGYLPQWTEEVFKIRRVIQGPVLMYKVEEFDGTPVQGTFYVEDLQKVTVDEDQLWRVERVLKWQHGQVLVRWRGWPSKYDSWIPAQ